MTSIRKGRRRKSGAAALSRGIALIVFTSPAFGQSSQPPPPIAATATWLNPVSGNWVEAAKWSTNPIYPNNDSPPGTTYDVTIAAGGAGPYGVALNSTISLNSLTLNSADVTVTQGNGTFVPGVLDIQAGYFRLGTTVANSLIHGAMSYAQGTTAPLTLVGSGIGRPTLDHVTLDTDVSVMSASTGDWWVLNGLVVQAGRRVVFDKSQEMNARTTQTISGGGEFDFAANACEVDNLSGTTLTIGAGITMKTIGTTGGAQIGTATSNNGAIVNNGTIWQTSPKGYTTLNGAFTNNGTIRVDDGSLNLGGDDMLGSWGNLIHNGGAINLVGRIHNTGQTFDFATTPLGPINLGEGAKIIGGTVVCTGGYVPQIRRVETNPDTHFSILQAVTLATPLDVNSVTLDLIGGLTLSGNPTIRLISDGSTTGLFLDDVSNSIGGGGVISIERTADAKSDDVRISTSNVVNNSLTFGPGITVRSVSASASITGGPINNQGLISAQGKDRYISFTGILNNSGTIEARNGGIISVSYAGSIPNNTLPAGGRWNVYANSTIDFNAHTFTTNNASILMDGLASSLPAAAPINNNAGSFEIDHGRNFATVGNLANSGLLRVGDDCTLTVNGTFSNTGTIEGSGTIVVTGGINSAGTTTPGNSPGTLHVTGDFTQTSAGTLSIEIGGTTKGVDYDLLSITGDATLAGTLQVSFVNGFMPVGGETFDFLDVGGAHSIQFDQVLLPQVAGGSWDTAALAGGGPLVFVPEPASALTAAAGISVLLRRRGRGS